MGTASVRGISVGYDDTGHGDPLVLVHGHPFDRSMWQPQAEYFARAGWRVIAPDLRGYGASTVVAGVTPLDVFADDVAALLDHLGAGPAVLCGLSMGGQIVMEFHRRHPRRVRGLVLADTSAAAETAEGRAARNAMADRLVREGMGPYADEVLPMMVGPRTVASRPEVVAHVLRMMRGTSPQGAAAALRGRAERPDYLDMLTRVTVPALVVVGSDDAFTPLPDAEAMHERLRDSTLVVVDGAGHMPNLERPDAFDAALHRYLEPGVCSNGRPAAPGAAVGA